MSVTEIRFNIFLRLIGLIVIIFGIATTYFIATTPLPSQITPVFYLISVLFMVSGFVAIIAKYE